MPWPTHAIDDIGILQVESKDDPTTPSGWTEVAGSPILATQGTNNARLSVFWKRATTTSEANASVTGAGDHGNAIITTYRGAITAGTPFDVLQTTTKNTSSTALSLAGVTATQNCNDVLYLVARAGDNGSAAQYSGEVDANLTSLTEIVDGS